MANPLSIKKKQVQNKSVTIIRALALLLVFAGMFTVPALAQDKARKTEKVGLEEVQLELEKTVIKAMEANAASYYKDGVIDTAAYRALFKKSLRKLFKTRNDRVEDYGRLQQEEQQILQQAEYLFREKSLLKKKKQISPQPPLGRKEKATQPAYEQEKLEGNGNTPEYRNMQEDEKERYEEKIKEKEQEILEKIRATFETEKVENGQIREKVKKLKEEYERQQLKVSSESDDERRYMQQAGQRDKERHEQERKEREEEILKNIRATFQTEKPKVKFEGIDIQQFQNRNAEIPRGQLIQNGNRLSYQNGQENPVHPGLDTEREYLQEERKAEEGYGNRAWSEKRKKSDEEVRAMNMDQAAGMEVQANETDSLALVALYNATNGDNWDNNENWLDGPLNTWYGVDLNEEGRVISIYLWSNNLSGELPQEIANLSELIQLTLPYNELTGTIPEGLSNLPLRYIQLSGNQLDRQVLSVVSNISTLEGLYLRDNDFGGSIPEGVGSLSNLVELDLLGNELEGGTPPGFGSLSLSYLRLDDNNLDRQVLIDISSISSLVILYAGENNFGGTIPSELSNLINLVVLDLSGNQFDGSIPSGFSNLSLTYLNLSNNQLDRQVMTDVSAIETLESLYIGGNSFGGTISVDLANIPNLRRLDLAYNQFEGTIPPGFENLPLDYLRLNSNNLDEQVLVDVSTIESLETLYLTNNNLSGTVPVELANLTNLERLNLSDNPLNGAIPDEFTTLSNLRYLYLYDTDLDYLPDLTALTNLWTLDLWQSKFTFDDLVPNKDVANNFWYNPQKPFGNPQLLEPELGETITFGVDLDYDGNQYQWYKDGVLLEGETTTEISISHITESDYGIYVAEVTNPALPDLTLASEPIAVVPAGYEEAVEADSLALVALYNATGGPNWNTNNNWLDGPLSTWEGVTTNAFGRVVELSLRYNWETMNGQLPSEIGDLDALRILNLYGNNFSGSIPEEIGQLTKLRYLSLGNNEFSGSIPEELADLTQLESLNLSNNDLEGALAESFSNLPLTYLNLSRNQLNREILADVSTISSLVDLYIGDNNFGGTIPSELTNLTNLRGLGLYGNQLTGSLPVGFSNLSLTYLNLSNNQLNQQILTDVSNIESLERLYLWSNNLPGNVPVELSNLTNLERLDLSNNPLNGAIPDEFTNLPNLRYLYLLDTDLDYLPDLSALTNLWTLDLWQSKFTFDDLVPNKDVADNFYYNPQKPFGSPQLLEPELGESIMFGIDLDYEGNQYQWYKDGVLLEGETATEISISHITESDYGIYVAEVTNASLPDLTLASEPIAVVPEGYEEEVEADSLALVAMYNATGGPNWNNNNNWLDGPLSTWEGVTTNAFGRVVELSLQYNYLSGQIPSEIGDLDVLRILNLYGNNLSGSIPVEIGQIKRLIYISLGGNEFSDSIPEELVYLTHLESLNLSYNDLEGTLAEGFSNLPLTYLNLSSNQLDRQVLDVVHDITSLESLYLGYNNFGGTIPSGLENLTNLVELDLSGNQFEGSISSGFSNLPLTYLYLSSNQLDPQVMTDVSTISSLIGLDLSSNGFQGEIPSALANLSNLRSLELDYNQFEGTIPSGFENLLVEYLRLNGNQLDPQVLIDVSNMESLVSLYLNDNDFGGDIPPELGNLNDLEDLYLERNEFEGEIPAELGNLSNLNYLNLSYNELIGEVPEEFNNLAEINGLYLYQTNLDSLPDLSALSNLWTLDVWQAKFTFDDLVPNKDVPNNFYYNSQKPFGNPQLLEPELGETLTLSIDLDYEGNQYQWYKNGVLLEGATDTEITISHVTESDYGTYIAEVTNPALPDLILESEPISLLQDGAVEADSLALVALYNATEGPNWNTNTNWLEGPLDTWEGVTVGFSGRVVELNLRYNNLSGELPEAIEDLTALQVLDLYGNNLNGPIPAEIGQLTSLNYLSLGNNDFKDSIPEEIGDLVSLTYLTLRSNELTGTIPEELSNLTQLESLNLSNNDLEGTLTESFSNLPLTYLNLSSNQLDRQVFDVVQDMVGLERVYLSYNNFGGTIPPGLANLANLRTLNLSGNQFEGSIPSAFSSLSIDYLYLSSNELDPQVMTDVSAISSLRGLDLGWNGFQGEIPSALANLPNLRSLELDYNQFEGTMPASFENLPLEQLRLNDNQLDPQVLVDVSNVQSLESLYLDDNDFGGTIPSGLGNLTNLRELDLDGNEFVGEIPATIGNLTNLWMLDLSDNLIKGAVPSEFTNLTRLSDLYLYRTNLDSLPDLSSLSNLWGLEVWDAKFTFDDLVPNKDVANYFWYNPQKPFGERDTLAAPEGSSITFGINLDYEGNEYQWYKDGTVLNGETSKQITITSVSESDYGTYTALVTNPALADLTLQSEPIILEEGEGLPNNADYSIMLSVSDDVDHTTTLTIGTAPDATTGYDAAYDQYAPPAPPTGAFDARIRFGDEDYLRFYQPTTSTSTEWPVRLRGASGTTSLSISWDPAALPQEGVVVLNSPSAGINQLNMAEYSHVNISEDELTDIVITHSLFEEYEVSYAEGWNLVGLALEEDHEHFSELFSDAISGTLFGFDGTYYVSDTLGMGEGYWLRFSQSEEVSYTGTTVDKVDRTLQEGWNLISGHAGCIPSCQLEDSEGIVIPGTMFGFNGVYQSADGLNGGHGYWLRTSDAGTVSIEPAPLAKSKEPSLQQVLSGSYHQVQVHSGDQQGMTLYFGETGAEMEKAIDNQQVILPPLPPKGAFDARLNSDRWWLARDSITIKVQQAEVPVTFTLGFSDQTSKEVFKLTEYGGQAPPRETVLEGGRKLQLQSSTTRVIVQALTELELLGTPEEYQLLQNYPNPFNPETTIRYALPEKSEVRVEIFNVMGQLVQTLVNEEQSAGFHEVRFDASMLSSGMYLYRIKAEDFVQTKRMVLLK
ncbi:leucine-rich repeat domain-containing protein [Gracilimonas mengyeensis]|uniref:Por secretion system C-terminal sorting domain-containing protein n=1 Tax=Gracilimonas mengyeensis TaxID=1302730 RepID=A0A521BVK2_9BACT|nr:T9SS type A sorting domain-containing protein [Gracilimonas mengyeensis]SMO50641.1 Por secretion system C-terminal sorting domain-containing protein [Gracilimonas mengyeensis]